MIVTICPFFLFLHNLGLMFYLLYYTKVTNAERGGGGGGACDPGAPPPPPGSAAYAFDVTLPERCSMQFN